MLFSDLSTMISFRFCFSHRQSGESKYVAKLSLDELQCFSEQVTNLPCSILEATLIKVSTHPPRIAMFISYGINRFYFVLEPLACT